MTAEPLGALFDRYRRAGDLAALARVVEAVAPELLRLARHLRPRGQAPEDLVQETLLAALTHHARYQVTRPLRPWLFGILLNKAAGGKRSELELDVELADQESMDKNSAERGAEAAEAARLLARGLERLPPIYSDVLRAHFFAGMSPAEIASHQGRPPGTVRAQLHRGLRLLRGLVPAGLASRLLWIGPSRSSLLRLRRAVLDQAADETPSVSVQPGAAPLASARIVGALAVAVALGVGWREWINTPQQPLLPEWPSSQGASEPGLVLSESHSHVERSSEDTPAREPNLLEQSATDGQLLVRVLYPDGSPASGIGLRVHAWGEPSWRNNRTDGVTDAAGEFSLERIHAGRVGIYCDRGGDQGYGADVSPGELTLRELALPRGVDVAGEVVDARGLAVAGAGIWLSESPLPLAGRVTVTCDEGGQFQLRDVSPRRFIGAQAAGYAPSEIEWLESGGLRADSSTRIRLILGDGGGSIAGTVFDALGSPVQGANVVARSKMARGVRLRQDGALLGPSAPFEVTTNDVGRFEFVGLALDEYEIVASAAGHPQQMGSVQLSASQPFDDLELRLPSGGKLSGTVSFPDGEPALGAVVIATSGALDFMDIDVDEHGAFVLEGLAPGEVEVQAGYGHFGGGQTARATLSLDPGGELRWNPTIERSEDYSGRIVGPRGDPLAGAWLRALSTESDPSKAKLPEEKEALAAWLAGYNDRYLKSHLSQIAADAEGRFTLRGVPRPFAIEVCFPEGRTGWPARVFDPPPANGEIALLPADRHTSRISGTIEGANGPLPATGVVYAVLRSGSARRVHLDANGAFEFEALPPGTFDVLLWARGHFPRVVAKVTLAVGEEHELGWLRLVD